MRQRVLATLAASVAIGLSAIALSASPAAADTNEPCPGDRFCAYQDADFHLRFLNSGAVRGQTVDIPNDRLTSVKNNRNNAWIGRDGRGILPDVTVFVFAPQSHYNNVGPGANDRIDYLIVD